MKPIEVDVLCTNYAAAQLAADMMQDKADAAKALVIEAVRSDGYVPVNAEASRRLEGADWCATVTTGKTVETRDETCGALEQLLSKARLPFLFTLLFERRVKYNLREKAHQALQQASLPPKFRDSILTTFAQCFIPKVKTPALKVEAIATVRKREENAKKKAAKKAAKKPAKTDS